MKKEQKSRGPIDLSRLRRISLKQRKNPVKVEDFARSVEPSAPFAQIINSLPHILAAASRLDLPATVHIALGTDIIHMHPEISGAEMGEASLIDFRKITSVVCELEGGVWLNIGSAVILPEVFLKAVAIARNLGYQLRNLTTANLDFMQHYRPRMNVVERPTQVPDVPGRGIALTGHHEIMLPLLRLAILTAMEKK